MLQAQRQMDKWIERDPGQRDRRQLHIKCRAKIADRFVRQFATHHGAARDRRHRRARRYAAVGIGIDAHDAGSRERPSVMGIVDGKNRFRHFDIVVVDQLRGARVG